MGFPLNSCALRLRKASRDLPWDDTLSTTVLPFVFPQMCLTLIYLIIHYVVGSHNNYHHKVYPSLQLNTFTVMGIPNSFQKFLWTKVGGRKENVTCKTTWRGKKIIMNSSNKPFLVVFDSGGMTCPIHFQLVSSGVTHQKSKGTDAQLEDTKAIWWVYPVCTLSVQGTVLCYSKSHTYHTARRRSRRTKFAKAKWHPLQNDDKVMPKPTAAIRNWSCRRITNNQFCNLIADTGFWGYAYPSPLPLHLPPREGWVDMSPQSWIALRLFIWL